MRLPPRYTAFFFASLLAKIRIIASIFTHRTWAHSSQRAHKNLSPFTIHRSRSISNQQAGWGKSGSKLHALQSFAPNASDTKSAPALTRLVRSPG